MSRRIEDLEPQVAVLCHRFVEECESQGISVIITSTFRSNEEQAALYAIGRTKPGNRVTNAKPGQSYHNWKIAFDFCPIVHGKAVWNNAELFERCGLIGEKVGLQWSGRFLTFRESAHMQLTQGHNLAYFQRGGKLA
jgi:peptidoglycan L-alanyl-D-glutamate endopeptidase CwlK